MKNMGITPSLPGTGPVIDVPEPNSEPPIEDPTPDVQPGIDIPGDDEPGKQARVGIHLSATEKGAQTSGAPGANPFQEQGSGGTGNVPPSAPSDGTTESSRTDKGDSEHRPGKDDNR